MLAKFRFNGITSYSALHDCVAALFETQATSLAQLLPAVIASTANSMDQANSYINTSKSSIGWTVAATSGSGSTRTTMLQSACKNSAKVKNVLLTAPSNLSSLATGNGRSGTTLVDGITTSNWYSTSAIAVSAPVIDLYVSSSNRHLLLHTVRPDTAVNVCAGVFEFVTNDGYYTESSPYIPVVQAGPLDSASSGFASGSRCLRVPRYKNMRTAGYPDVTAQQCYWETPYSEDEFMPADNGGYDYLGASTDRTPLLVSFGVCNKTTHAFIGGAISDLCDIYLGPTNVGANYEDTLIGTDTYVAIPIASGQKRLFVPKG